ncbi:putative ww domain-binding protein 2 [Aphelenchoides fujianensis]|nr:putative ww domain-binding protein 2 [Aphelenchoides fujianensis]
MSANQSHTSDGHGVLLYNGEFVLVYAKHVTLAFDAAPEHFFKGKKNGNLYLTTHRLIFLASDHGELKSLAMPFSCISNVKLEQPIFGANYLEGQLAAQPGGNFEGEVGWKLTFSKGGCIDFGKALRQAVMIVRDGRPNNAPPPYVPPAGSFFAPPPAYFNEPVPLANGMQAPTHVFPDRPEQGTVFVWDQPPPYGGINQPGSHPPIYPDLSNAGANAPPPYPAGGSAHPTPNAPPSYENATALPQKSKAE